MFGGKTFIKNVKSNEYTFTNSGLVLIKITFLLLLLFFVGQYQEKALALLNLLLLEIFFPF